MPGTIFVISDLHLGGRPGFQICSPSGRRLLADFLEWLAGLAANDNNLHLIVNGDLVDFLAETPFAEFTANDRDATSKLQSILTSSTEIWKAFHAITARGAEVTVLLGNHDLELALPGPSRLLREAIGPGRVNFLFDNQALDLGEVLIEHGNRYDAWNAVDHDALRQVCSAVSRRETPIEFPAPAGSRLVIDVMNDVKEQLRFVDLLKPENDAVLPLLAALTPFSATQIRSVVRYHRQMKRVRFGPQQTPLDSGNIADVQEAQTVPDGAGAALAEAFLEAETDTDSGDIGFSEHVDFLHLWRVARNPARRDQLLDRLYTAFRHRLGAESSAFKVSLESPEYLTAAEASAARGFKVVLYGHTHLAKRVPLANGSATYLNTGTWADLMMLPESVLQGNKVVALGELESFVDDLEHNRLDRWRTPLPTFARLEMANQKVLTADVCIYAGGGRCEPVPAEMLEPVVVNPTPPAGV
jgi:UDP-2,3-diacylglucosamine pyrophosphatase LpxH